MTIKRWLFIGLLIGGLVVISVIRDQVHTINEKEQKIERNNRMIDSIDAVTKQEDSIKEYERGKTRGYDFGSGKYIHYPTDEQIRLMREQNPEYIIKAPGRQIRNRRQISEQEIEDYLEEHPEALDEYRD